MQLTIDPPVGLSSNLNRGQDARANRTGPKTPGRSRDTHETDTRTRTNHETNLKRPTPHANAHPHATVHRRAPEDHTRTPGPARVVATHHTTHPIKRGGGDGELGNWDRMVMNECTARRFTLRDSTQRNFKAPITHQSTGVLSSPSRSTAHSCWQASLPAHGRLIRASTRVLQVRSHRARPTRDSASAGARQTRHSRARCAAYRP